MKIGPKIRSYRKEKGMTLGELSQRTGVALATLSRMENGKMSGTVKSHGAICKALGISISDLYREIEDSSKTIEPGRDKKSPEKVEGSGKIRYELLVARSAGKKMVPTLLRISPGKRTQPERDRPGTEKFLYILRGNIEADISGKKYPMKKGDSLYFESSLRHLFHNPADSDAEIISIYSSDK
ncbi:MAG TPA: XRE family transcriptional regulator [Candidatus Omnitrophota bacterium]|nr:XRE family transcriptional regulator [Candidatus Omnitrophota bacterium]